MLPRGDESSAGETTRGEATLSSLRIGDVVVLDPSTSDVGRDFIVEGVITLREGNTTSVVAVMADGDRRGWLVGSENQPQWIVARPVGDHGLRGEPPRNIRRESGLFTLERRGQASAASVGRHERPSGSRAATYLYRAAGRDVLWLERWGSEVLMAEGTMVEANSVSFLPGS